MLNSIFSTEILDITASVFFVVFLASLSIFLLIVFLGFGKNDAVKFALVSANCSTCGSVIGFIFGVSVSPIVEPLASGMFGLIGGLALYIFGKDNSSGWLVGVGIISFSFALLICISAASVYSRPAKDYDFCLNVLSDPKINQDIISRMSDHCSAVIDGFVVKS